MNKIIIPVLASGLFLGTLGLSQDVFADFEVIDILQSNIKLLDEVIERW